MSALPKTIAIVANNEVSTGEKLLDKFAGRSSGELVIALAGPIGCGISSIVDTLVGQLRDLQYEDVVLIKLSGFLQKEIDDGVITPLAADAQASQRYNRYRTLQEAGLELRRRTKNPAILAEVAIRDIVVDRRRRLPQPADGGASPIVPKRVAYIIDQVKRPEEVALLRAVYRNLFYLIGVNRIREGRSSALRSEFMSETEVTQLMVIDQAESSPNGQQLGKTLHLADYFIRNDGATIEQKNIKVRRLLHVMHGDKSVTPTDIEHGMYAAYTAGLRSACLSRQVGAAIAGPTGEVLATGCNDVPRPHGGLYSSSSPGPDRRCIHLDGAHCFNDRHKHNLQEQIGKEVKAALSRVTRDGSPITLQTSEIAEILESVSKNTGIKDLIEFSRSVHAEMDAIVSLARLGGPGLKGATLYSTTFPCHSCARHIVAAGIIKVFYIEPYEKSLARDLHKDEIAFEVDAPESETPQKVAFLHFEGVSPRQFNNAFRAQGRKDESGTYVPMARSAEKAVPEYIDNYQDFETKAVSHLNDELQKLHVTGG